MSVICWDGNELATDSQSSCQHLRRAGTSRRLYAAGDWDKWRVEGKKAVAFAFVGEGAPGPWIAEAMTQGLDHKTTLACGMLNFQAIIICDDCAFVWRYVKEGRGDEVVNTLLPIEAPYAIGTGKGIATGVMSIGRSAKQAVEHACKWDLNSGGLIQSFRRQVNTQKEEVISDLNDLADKAKQIAEGNFDNPDKLQEQAHELHQMALKVYCRAMPDLFPEHAAKLDPNDDE